MIHYYLSFILKAAILYQTHVIYFERFHEIQLRQGNGSEHFQVFSKKFHEFDDLKNSSTCEDCYYASTKKSLFHDQIFDQSACRALDFYLSITHGYIFSFCKSIKHSKVYPILYNKSEQKDLNLGLSNNDEILEKQQDYQYALPKEPLQLSKTNKVNYFNSNNILSYLNSFNNYSVSFLQKILLSIHETSNHIQLNYYHSDDNKNTDFLLHKRIIQKNKIFNLIQSYLYFTFHNEIVENPACDIEFSTECLSLTSCIPGICTFCSEFEAFNKTTFKNYALQLASSSQVSLVGSTEAIKTRFAYGLVLLNTGHLNRSVLHFNRFVKTHSTSPLALQALAVALFRLDPKANAELAIKTQSKAVKLTQSSEAYLKRAELQFFLGDYLEAYKDITSAIRIGKNSWYPHLFRALVDILLTDWDSASEDIKSALKLKPDNPHLLILLGHVMMQQGALRKALEAFREAGAHSTGYIDAFLRAGDVLRLLGETEKADELLRSLLAEKLTPEQHYAVRRLLTLTFTEGGRPTDVLEHSKMCLELREDCSECLVARMTALTELGQFFPAVKASAKLIAGYQNTPHLIRSFYLREWARFLHLHIDEPFIDTNFSTAFPVEFRVHFATGQPLQSTSDYREFPGLRPSQGDLGSRAFQSLTFSQQEVFCTALKIKGIFAVDSDAVANRARLHVAFALSSLHVAQLVLNSSRVVSWVLLTDLAARYAQLGDLTTPCVLMYSLPKDVLGGEGLRAEYRVVQKDRPNPALATYRHLVFQLVKTMIEHSRGPSNGRLDVKQRFEQADTLRKVLNAAKERGTYRKDDLGLVVGTQVPSIKFRDHMRHEGAYLALTENHSGATSLAVRLRLRTLRLTSYRDELETLVGKLISEIRRGPSSPESIANQVLTILYYSVNAAPVGARRSAGVGLSLALGLLLASGMTARGRLPPGKALELEPVLAGTPDAFVLVTHQWLKPGPLAKSDAIQNLASLEVAFPTVRSILELLAIDTNVPCGHVSV